MATTVSDSSQDQQQKKKAADPNEIWSASEVLEAGDFDDVDDGRAQPEYDIVFKQNVTPEDFFLGVDPIRHPGVSCSDALVLKVTLPNTKLADIDLDVRPTFVRVSAPKYKLKAHLGEKVDENKGNAKVRERLHLCPDRLSSLAIRDRMLTSLPVFVSVCRCVACSGMPTRHFSP